MFSKKILPEVGLKANTIDFNSEVLPEPYGPIIAICSPLLIEIFIFDKASSLSC